MVGDQIRKVNFRKPLKSHSRFPVERIENKKIVLKYKSKSVIPDNIKKGENVKSTLTKVIDELLMNWVDEGKGIKDGDSLVGSPLDLDNCKSVNKNKNVRKEI